MHEKKLRTNLSKSLCIIYRLEKRVAHAIIQSQNREKGSEQLDRNFLKQSIRRELDYYKDGLFNEDEDEYWERAWAAPDDDDSMAENGFLNVAMAHLQGDECDEIVLLGTEYGYHEPDYDSYIDIGHAFVNDMGTGFLQTEGTEDDWEQLIDDIAEILAGKTQ